MDNRLARLQALEAGQPVTNVQNEQPVAVADPPSAPDGRMARLEALMAGSAPEAAKLKQYQMGGPLLPAYPSVSQDQHGPPTLVDILTGSLDGSHLAAPDDVYLENTKVPEVPKAKKIGQAEPKKGKFKSTALGKNYLGLTPEEQEMLASMAVPVDEKRRPDLLERGVKQYANKTALETLEKSRPDSQVVGSISRMADTLEKLDEDPFMRNFDRKTASVGDHIKMIGKLWWGMTKSAFSSGDKAKEAVAIEALKEKRPAATYDVPPAENMFEKAADVTAGLGAFMTQYLVARKLIPPGMILSDMAAFEAINQIEGGAPGKGAVTAGSLGAIGKIPTASITGKVAQVGAQSGLFAGLTAIEGGSTDDVIVSALIPIVLAPVHHSIKKNKVKQVKTQLTDQATKNFRAQESVIKKNMSKATRAGNRAAMKQHGYELKNLTMKYNAHMENVNKAASLFEAEINNSREYGGSNKSAGQYIEMLQKNGFQFGENSLAAKELAKMKGDPRFMPKKAPKGDILEGAPITKKQAVVETIKHPIKAAKQAVVDVVKDAKIKAAEQRPSAASAAPAATAKPAAKPVVEAPAMAPVKAEEKEAEVAKQSKAYAEKVRQETAEENRKIVEKVKAKASEYAGKIFKHFTSPESKKALESGKDFDHGLKPIHGTGSLGKEEKIHRFMGDYLYLSLADKTWSQNSRFVPTGDPAREPTKEDLDAGIAGKPRGEAYYDYENQKWMLEPGELKTETLEPVEYKINDEARTYVIDSVQKLKDAIDMVKGLGGVASGYLDMYNNEIWKTLSKKYDLVVLKDVRKVIEETDHKFFKAAKADQIVVLNKDVVSVVNQVVDSVKTAKKVADTVKKVVDKTKTAYTNAPKAWRKETVLIDMGEKGLRAKGGKAMPASDKGKLTRRTFIWDDFLSILPVRLPTKTMNEIKKRTEEVWRVESRTKDNYWLAPTQLIDEMKKELGEEAFVQQEKKPRSKKQRFNDEIMGMKVAEKRGEIDSSHVGEGILDLAKEYGISEDNIPESYQQYIQDYKERKAYEQKNEGLAKTVQEDVEREVHPPREEDLERAAIQAETEGGSTEDIGDFLDGLYEGEVVEDKPRMTEEQAVEKAKQVVEKARQAVSKITPVEGEGDIFASVDKVADEKFKGGAINLTHEKAKKSVQRRREREKKKIPLFADDVPDATDAEAQELVDAINASFASHREGNLETVQKAKKLRDSYMRAATPEAAKEADAYFIKMKKYWHSQPEYAADFWRTRLQNLEPEDKKDEYANNLGYMSGGEIWQGKQIVMENFADKQTAEDVARRYNKNGEPTEVKHYTDGMFDEGWVLLQDNEGEVVEDKPRMTEEQAAEKAKQVVEKARQAVSKITPVEGETEADRQEKEKKQADYIAQFDKPHGGKEGRPFDYPNADPITADQVDGVDNQILGPAAQIIDEQYEFFMWPTDNPKKVSAEKIAKDRGEVLTPEEAKQRIDGWKKEAASGKSDLRGKLILSLFDRTGVWSQPFIDAGADVLRVDVNNEWDLNIFDITPDWLIGYGYEDVDGIIAAPPCTDFSGSGARWWAEKDKQGVTNKSRAMVDHTLEVINWLKPHWWVLENPVGRVGKQTGIGEPQFQFQPNNFGDPYTKRTQLWGNFNTDLPQANVDPTEGSRVHKLRGDNPEQKAARSITPEGFSYAFFMAQRPEVIQVLDQENEEAKYDFFDLMEGDKVRAISPEDGKEWDATVMRGQKFKDPSVVHKDYQGEKRVSLDWKNGGMQLVPIENIVSVDRLEAKEDKDLVGRKQLEGGTTGDQKEMLEKDKFKTIKEQEKEVGKQDILGQKDFFGGEKKPDPKLHSTDKSKPKASDTGDLFAEDDTGTLFESKKPVEEKPSLSPPIIDTSKSLISEHTRMMGMLDKSEMSADQVQEAFEILADSEEQVKAELKKKTIKQLLPFAGIRAKGEKKAVVVDMVYNEMLREYALNKSVTYSPMEEKYIDGLRRAVESVTDEDLKKGNEAKKAKEDLANKIIEDKIQEIKNEKAWVDFGDKVIAPDGTIGIVRGSGGSSGRVKLVDENGNKVGTFYNRSDLKPAPAEKELDFDSPVELLRGGSHGTIQVKQNGQWYQVDLDMTATTVTEDITIGNLEVMGKTPEEAAESAIERQWLFESKQYPWMPPEYAKSAKLQHDAMDEYEKKEKAAPTEDTSKVVKTEGLHDQLNKQADREAQRDENNFILNREDLTVTHLISKKGKPYWAVTGSGTLPHKELLTGLGAAKPRRIKGKWTRSFF